MTTLNSAPQRNYHFFAKHFGGNIRIFVANTWFVLPLSTPCCLLEVSKRLSRFGIDGEEEANRSL